MFLIKIERKAYNRDGDGKIDHKYLWYILLDADDDTPLEELDVIEYSSASTYVMAEAIARERVARLMRKENSAIGGTTVTAALLKVSPLNFPK